MLRILHQDARCVAVHKPAGMVVHRTRLATDRRTLMHALRDQIGQHVFPIHRLDRGTAGIVLFALDPEAASSLGQAMMQHALEKEYLAIVRGWPAEAARIDHPLEKDGSGELQPAVTTFRRLATAELPIPVDRYATARYSLLALQLETGRLHQIRRHMAHLRHPVLGDRKRGDRHHNRMWREQLGIEGMMLLAWRLRFPHPDGHMVQIRTEPHPPMAAAMERLGWRLPD